MASRSSNVFNVGGLECRILYDGARSVGAMTDGPAEAFIFGDAPQDELRRSLSAYGGFGSSTVLPFNYLLVHDGDRYTLIDAGCSDRAENDQHPDEPAGMLTWSLREAGVTPGDVDTVVISHSHWDHFGGVVSGGEPAYPNAKHVMSRKEVQHIRDESRGWALDYLNTIKDRLTLVDGPTAIGGGVAVRPAPGHTPGMLVAEASSGSESLLYTSDVIIHPAHVEHTDWIPSFEHDPRAAAATRARLVEEAHRRDMLLFVPHIPGVLGRVEHHQEGYRWVEEPRRG